MVAPRVAALGSGIRRCTPPLARARRCSLGRSEAEFRGEHGVGVGAEHGRRLQRDVDFSSRNGLSSSEHGAVLRVRDLLHEPRAPEMGIVEDVLGVHDRRRRDPGLGEDRHRLVLGAGAAPIRHDLALQLVLVSAPGAPWRSAGPRAGPRRSITLHSVSHIRTVADHDVHVVVGAERRARRTCRSARRPACCRRGDAVPSRSQPGCRSCG